MATSKPLRNTRDDKLAFPIKMWATIGTARGAEDALATIGQHWDNLPFTGNGVNGGYEFEMDGFMFTVTVDAIPEPLDVTHEFADDDSYGRSSQ